MASGISWACWHDWCDDCQDGDNGCTCGCHEEDDGDA